MKLIHSIPAKSSHLDFIPTSLIKSCSSVFADIITRLANLSFSQRKFPDKYKAASVTPLLKKVGLDENNPANYRPISNLNNISKLLERLFLSRIESHVCSSPNFSAFQSAYRRYHSTETALLHTLNDIFSFADACKPNILVSLDLSAAFDMIDHSILLRRLESAFGISGAALSWLQSYLFERQQSIRAGHISSSPDPITAGVPQGSVLGPFLFLCYTSPIFSLVSSHNICLQQYADDTAVYIALTAADVTTQLNNLTNCLSTLYHWLCLNGLALNSSKSEAILFGTRQRLRVFPTVPSVTLADSQLHLSDSITILGVTLDNTLSLNQHVTKLCRSMHFHIRAIKHIRSALTDDMAASVACCLVQSRLDYANSILYKTSASNIHKLQSVQNTLSRVVLPHLSHLPANLRLKQLHWLPVEWRIKFKLALLTYKTLSNHQPAYLRSLLAYYIPPRDTRSASQRFLALPQLTSEFGRRAFCHSAPYIWNQIPLNIRSAPSVHSFKHQLKAFYFNQIDSG